MSLNQSARLKTYLRTTLVARVEVVIWQISCAAGPDDPVIHPTSDLRHTATRQSSRQPPAPADKVSMQRSWPNSQKACNGRAGHNERGGPKAHARSCPQILPIPMPKTTYAVQLACMTIKGLQAICYVALITLKPARPTWRDAAAGHLGLISNLNLRATGKDVILGASRMPIIPPRLGLFTTLPPSAARCQPLDNAAYRFWTAVNPRCIPTGLEAQLTRLLSVKSSV
ncbi:uncharacterized protein B0H18DRAFT_954578 [Fomitopsis serialis]|uniref:uncharacterized protein n=1 Tax=Fomitopsis serialis TaxID=139415 RepID=UPI0020086714|nr:uncharacterized protein B0H18DRAFT_954578 [Neoantrodia serialis]KAH9927013.1 hypothetical protein B0H18DRAFT_954578 [Neoantrodia serialis]